MNTPSGCHDPSSRQVRAARYAGREGRLVENERLGEVRGKPERGNRLQLSENNETDGEG